MLALTLIAAAAAGTAAQEPPLRLLCRFESACIDRRPCFDSSAEVVIRGIDGAADLAQLDFGDGRVRTARIRREGVWTSLVTEPASASGAIDRVQCIFIGRWVRA